MDKILNKEGTKDKALRLLSFRSHSEKELRDKLLRAGATKENIDEVIQFLLEYKLLNDEAYAISKASDLANLKKFGKRRIAEDLKMRGISPEYIEKALMLLEINEGETLMPLMEKKLKGDFEKKSIERAMRYFSARGYGYDDIKMCIDELKSREQE